MKNKKKRFSSQITPNGYEPFASFCSTILAREGIYVHSLRGATESYARISVPAHKFRVEDPQKKGLRCEILDLVLAFTCVFCPGTRLCSRLEEGTSSGLGGHGPEMPPWRWVCVAHAVEYVIATYFLQARKHQFLNAQSTFLSKLDESQGGESPTVLGRFTNFHVRSLHQEIF